MITNPAFKTNTPQGNDTKCCCWINRSHGHFIQSCIQPWPWRYNLESRSWHNLGFTNNNCIRHHLNQITREKLQLKSLYTCCFISQLKIFQSNIWWHRSVQAAWRRFIILLGPLLIEFKRTWPSTDMGQPFYNLWRDQTPLSCSRVWIYNLWMILRL